MLLQQQLMCADVSSFTQLICANHSKSSGRTCVRRLAVGQEYFAMQLLPVLLPPCHPAARYFDEEGFRRAGALAGNAMNIIQVGSMLLYMLCSVDPPAQSKKENNTCNNH